jgi:type 1 glutamine amidotransferase
MNLRPLRRRLLLSAALAVSSIVQANTPVLFIAGEPSHGPGEHRFPDGCVLLADALNASGLSVKAEVSRGWPSDAALARARTVVIYSDGLDLHVAEGKVAALRAYAKPGKGLAVLHFALEPSAGELSDFLLQTVGGRFEVDWSVNPVWTIEKPIVARHEVTRGVSPFEIDDEWYYHLRFRAGVVPVLQAVPSVDTLGQDGPRSGNPAVREALAKRQPQTLGWVYEGAGLRTFGFTGGHFHRNWANDDFRKLVLNGIVWTAGVTVPARGVPSATPAIPHFATIDEAIARGDLEDVRRHLAIDPARVKGAPDAALAPLHQAILRNRTEIAMVLLEAGADPSAADRSQRTPVHLAVERGNLALVETLLARKAAASERDRMGWTPLHHAAAKDRLEIAKALIKGGADYKALSERGGTPLHEAAASGSAEMVKLFLDHGVDPGIVSKLGVTALDIAREFNNEAAIAVLSQVTGTDTTRPKKKKKG